MHQFLLQPSIWVGEGQVSFPTSKEIVRFFTRWRTQEAPVDTIKWLQEVELHGLQQTTFNYFTIFDLKGDHFRIILENEMIGKASGKGVVDKQTLAWELRDHPGMEGYEVYELQKDGEYTFRAEYSSPDRFHTRIEGKLWKKSA
jgi:hypothetical protein